MATTVIGIVFVLLVFAVPVLVYVLLRLRQQYREIQKRYGPNFDAAKDLEEAANRLASMSSDRAALEFQCASLKDKAARLAVEIGSYEDGLEIISSGLYKPHYDFKTSEGYKAQLDALYERQKEAIRRDEATYCPHEWHVEGSRSRGKQMQKQQGKLLLRAFNGECDAMMARVAWNNVDRMEKRIEKTFEAVNDLGTAMHIEITDKYYKLKLEELWLTHEYQEKKHEEQEEQKRIREEMREAERAEKEIRAEQEKAQAEEERYAKALAKAQEEVAHATGKEFDKLSDKIRALQEQLTEAQRRKERATSMAQLTKAGHVYIISNIGSFGEEVFKIGMTRRLDPYERVHELGDASVPFEFDVHAMVYSEDAPGLENAFHREFHSLRVNAINTRKEFFRVSLLQIEEFARKRGLTVELTRIAEARHYRETMALRAQKSPAEAPAVQVASQVPVTA